jgi:hypothetical protein
MSVTLKRTASVLGLSATMLAVAGQAHRAHAQQPPSAAPSSSETSTAPPGSTEPTVPAIVIVAPVPPVEAPAVATSATAKQGSPAEARVSTSASLHLDPSQEAEAEALEAALLHGALQDTATDGYKLDLYGFADVTYVHALQNFAYGVPYNSFAVGRINVYAASELGDNWRGLVEARLSYLPHGVTVYGDTGEATRIDTSVADYTDLGRPVRWGGVVLERAWLEYTAHPLLSIKAGQWLTPYGVWNVDHGSPVIIGVRRPFIVGESLFPQTQTGVILHGIHHLPQVKLGYAVTLSNGRGPLDTYQDLDRNKAIGGRLSARCDSPVGTLALGASGYLGRYTDRGEQSTITPEGFRTERPRTAEYDELSLAADLKWEWEGFLFQSEGILNEVSYEDSLRPADYAFSGGPPGFVPDFRRYGVYGLTGYRFEWIGLMPFAGLEYYRAAPSSFAPKAAAFWGGLNVRPTPRVVLKAQYTYSWFPDEPPGLPPNSHYNSIDCQAAWSF